MNYVKKLLGAGAATLAILAGSAAIATPASAKVGEQKCGTSGIFRMCIKSVDDGYDVWVTNNGSSGSDRILDFRLQCQGYWYGDQGSFWSSVDSTHSYVFQVPHQTCYPKLFIKDPDFGPSDPGHWLSFSSLTVS